MKSGLKNNSSKFPVFLVIDVSNSFTKYAIVSGGKTGPVQRCPTPDITVTWALRLMKKHSGMKIILSCVVPRISAIFEVIFGKSIFHVQGHADLGFPILYPDKKQIGADRLANAAAARALYGNPSVVLDFGTAVTFDIINPKGAYCGGVIAPGLNAMTDYLHEKTALLPAIEIREPRRSIGKSTEEAMRIGAVIGYRGLVREILSSIQSEMKLRKPLRAIATGGQASIVCKGMKEIHSVHPTLTLEGLRLIGTHVLKTKN